MASNDIYKVSSDDFMAFNIVSDYVAKSQNQTISSTNVTINFETSSGALGYAIDCGSYIDAYFTNNAKLTISNGNVTKVEQGYYTDDTFTNESTLSVSNTIEVEANKLYKIEYTSSGKITSSTWDNIGA